MRLRILALAVPALAALAGVLWITHVVDAPGEEAAPPPAATKDEAPREAAGGERAALAPSSEPIQELPVTPREVRGRVVDLDGAGVPNVRVREPAEDAEGVRTGDDGRFVATPSAEDWTLAVDEEGWTTLRAASFEDAPALEGVRIVAAHATAFDGRVVDREGRPLPGARVELRSEAFETTWTFHAGFEGRFRAESIPAGLGVRATVALAGWRTLERSLELPAAAEIRFVLDREDPSTPEIEGEVVHADGSPTANALVAFGPARTRTDGRGAFRLLCGWFDERTPLVAVERGLEACILEGFGASCLPPASSPPPARLVLPGRAHAIAGRVLTERGEACKGFDVFVLDATPFDPAGSPRDVVEAESAGPVRCRTDAEGRFRLGGLRGRSYSILAAGSRRSAREVVLRAERVAADTLDLELRVPENLSRAPIRGRVVDLSGTPVAGARVGIGRAVPPGDPGEFGRLGGRDAMSGPDGRFELPDAPAGAVDLVASADGCVPSRAELAPDAPRNAVELVVRARRELRIDASRASPAPDSARAIDAAGRPIPLWSGAHATIPVAIAPLRAGIAEPISASGDTRWIVLGRAGREVARIPLPPGPTGSGPVELAWP